MRQTPSCRRPRTRGYVARGLAARHPSAGGGALRGPRPSASDTHSIIGLVRDDLGGCPSGPSTTCSGPHRRGAPAKDSPAGLRGALRVAGRRQPSPPRVPLVRRDRRRRLRRGQRALPDPADDHGFVIDEAEVVFWGLFPRAVRPLIRFHPPVPEEIPLSDKPDAEVGEMNEQEAGGCPFHPARAPHPTKGNANSVWWPNQLNLKILAKNPAVANPLGEDFDYTAAFEASTSRRSRPTSTRCSPRRRTGGPRTSATTARS